jgi:hypothetical protein
METLLAPLGYDEAQMLQAIRGSRVVQTLI